MFGSLFPIPLFAGFVSLHQQQQPFRLVVFFMPSMDSVRGFPVTALLITYDSFGLVSPCSVSGECPSKALDGIGFAMLLLSLLVVCHDILDGAAISM